jgi:diadenosine tetraphosphate (Ap4A) HIT family hydrolase
VNELSRAGCELCDSAGGDTLWHDDFCRVVLVADPDYPGFCRVILNHHVSEMTDLKTGARERLMRVVFAAEARQCGARNPARGNRDRTAGAARQVNTLRTSANPAGRILALPP